MGAALCAVATAVAACGSASSSTSQDPRALLTAAKAKADASRALHFSLSSENAGGADIYVRGGDGDAVRPDGFSGTFDVFYQVANVKVGVASVGGKFYIHLPFGTGWDQTDPSKYGFADPGRLINPDSGLSSLLSREKTATLDSRDRYNGEELDEVHVTLPGALVAALLTSADPSKDVDAEIGIAVDSGQARRVKLTGPFFMKDRMSTYTVILTGYGEDVKVTPPA